MNEDNKYRKQLRIECLLQMNTQQLPSLMVKGGSANISLGKTYHHAMWDLPYDLR